MITYIVIPAVNSEATIGKVLTDLQAAGYAHCVVIDDGSTDRTAAVAQAHGAHVIRHMINLGQGAGLQTGTVYALAQGAELLVHFDADGQMDPGDIATLLKPLQSGTIDVAIGSRYLQNDSDIPMLKRYVYFPIGRVVNLLFTGLWLSDAHCGLRALTAQAAHNITIRQDRMAHATEILELISKKNLRYVEVPVTIQYHEFGQGLRGINGALRTVKDLIKAKLL